MNIDKIGLLICFLLAAAGAGVFLERVRVLDSEHRERVCSEHEHWRWPVPSCHHAGCWPSGGRVRELHCREAVVREVGR